MSPQRRGRTVPLLFLNLALTHSAGAQESPSKESGPPRDIVIERLETAYRWQNDGTGEIVQSARIRVLTEAGRGAVGQFYFPYSSQLEETRIDYFQTVKADGRKVPVDPSQVFEMASPLARDAPTFSDLKLKALAAPNLEVGDSLEYQVTHVTRVPLKPGDFWVIYSPNRQTVVESEVVVLNVPAGRKLTLKTHPEYHAAYSEQEQGGRKIYRWQFSNPHPVKSEEGPVKPLFAASTLDDWKQVGEWYMQLQAGRTQVTPEIQSLVAKLTAGKTTPREKLDAIYTYVSESIRYVAIHFGIGGFQAHAAADVLRNGYGDCKDKHGLLSAMLDAAGMKAYPVLANSQQGVIELDVPMPAQFDHVVSVFPVNGQKVWLDTTLEFAPPGFMPASMRGKQALLIDLSATRLAEIPKEPAVPENAHLTSQGRLDP